MANLKHLNRGQMRFQDAQAIFMTPYEDGLLGETTYDIHDIVGDTLAVTQEDAERTEIPWEFGDDPLDENTTLGAKNFTAQCLDFQDDIMLALFGCSKVNDAIVFPKEYKDLYVMIRVQFKDKDLVLPYVKMDAKATLENMRSDIARGELSGTLYAREVVIADKPAAGAQAPATAVTKTADNSGETAMCYVPNGESGKAVYVAGTGTTETTTVYLTDVHEDAVAAAGE